MAIRHINQIELAARWNISHRTLERWRCTGEGPQFIKIGGRVVYRQEDVEAYEAEQIRKPTAITPANAAPEVEATAPLAPVLHEQSVAEPDQAEAA
jgi:predicted DNA-binding transcriptional regulator AlpA